MHGYIDAHRQLFSFRGRARRSEYWYFQLFNALAQLIGTTILGFTAEASRGTLLHLLFRILFYLALGYVAVSWLAGTTLLVRRLHDTGRSGWWFYIGMLPLIGNIVLLIFCVQDSQPGQNRFGPNPKARVPADNIIWAGF